MTTDQINEGLRLEAGTTPGKWTSDNYAISSGEYKAFTGCRSHTDAEFLCFLRNHALELLECARRCAEMDAESLTK